MRRLLAALALCLFMAAPAVAQIVAGQLPQLPAALGPNGGLKVECIAGTCTGSGGTGADVNITAVGGNAVTTSVPVTFSNTTIAVTHANFANLDAALSTLATQATLALIKAKTDNLDVALSTRTKPADSQHATIDNATLAVTQSGTWNVGTLTSITNAVTVTGPLTDTQLRATPVPVSGTVTVTDGAGALNTIVDSGTITANAGTNLNTSLLALESGGNLATVKTNTDPLVASGAGGYVRQDSTATIAKESGGNLAALAGKDFATSAKQDTGNTSLSTIASQTRVRGTSGSPTLVMATDQDTTLLASNASRVQWSVCNQSRSPLFLKFGSGASRFNYSVRVAAGQCVTDASYTGQVNGVWDFGADAFASLTESQ